MTLSIDFSASLLIMLFSPATVAPPALFWLHAAPFLHGLRFRSFEMSFAFFLHGFFFTSTFLIIASPFLRQCRPPHGVVEEAPFFFFFAMTLRMSFFVTPRGIFDLFSTFFTSAGTFILSVLMVTTLAVFRFGATFAFVFLGSW